jgi:hypothetical protein
MSGIFDGLFGSFLGGMSVTTPSQQQQALLGQQANAWNAEMARPPAELSRQTTIEERAEIWIRYAFNAAPRPESGIHWRREGGKRWTVTIFR